LVTGGWAIVGDEMYPVLLVGTETRQREARRGTVSQLTTAATREAQRVLDQAARRLLAEETDRLEPADEEQEPDEASMSAADERSGGRHKEVES